MVKLLLNVCLIYIFFCIQFQVVREPEKAAKRKISKQLKKKSQKKKKIEAVKKGKFKRKKSSN